jgi:hypothetical protein
VAIAANPDSLSIQAPAGRTGWGYIYINATRNIIHLDYASLHALERSVDDCDPGVTQHDAFLRQLNGFENIVNVSVPVASNFPLLKRLREDAHPFSGVPAPPILGGVTCFENLAGHPDTISSCQLYVDNVRKEVDIVQLPRPQSQRNVINRLYAYEVGVLRINYIPNLIVKTSIASTS